MTFGIGFILLLMALGGFAAYQGDRVGMAVGRKRLTIFGLRPKYTSRIITVLTGIIIVAITMASVLLISHTARQSLFGLEKLQSQIAELTLELNALEGRQRSLLAENAALQERNQALISENDHLQSQNLALHERNEELAARRDELEQTVQALEIQYERLRGSSYLIYDYVMQVPLVYEANEVIDHYVIDVPPTREQLKQAVLDTLARLNERVLQDGAGEYEPGSGWALYLEVEVEDVALSADEHIEALVDSIWSVPEVDSVILRVSAKTHTLRGSFVVPEFWLVGNVTVYHAGDTIDAKVFDGRLSGRELFNQVWAWLQTDIRRAARERGLLGRPDGTVTAPIEPGTLYEVVENIRRAGGPVLVRAISAYEARTGDELTLGFVYEPVPEGGTG